MESIFSIIFAFLVEAIILLQYTSRLFSPKRPLSDRLVVLSLLYTCLCAAAFFNIKWLNMLLYLFTNFLFFGHTIRCQMARSCLPFRIACCCHGNVRADRI